MTDHDQPSEPQMDPLASRVPSGPASLQVALAAILTEEAGASPLDDVPPQRIDAYVAEVLPFIADRPPGRAKIAVRAGSLIEATSVVEILNDDMPFLLDSTVAEMQARGIAVRLVLHPILTVQRDATGAIQSLAGKASLHGAARESFISIHVDALSEEASTALQEALVTVFENVRVAVTDWRAMLVRLQQATAELSTETTSAATDAVAFLRWLAADHFTFLGMRELRLVGDLETGDLRADPDGGLGLLRDASVEVLRRGLELVATTPEIRSFLAGSEPIIVTKSNMISRVHRRVQMDYIGIKTRDADGKVTGELRIVGLFTSRAYLVSPLGVPLLRDKVEAVQRRAGFLPESHDAKAMLNIIETFPRDELYQISADMLADWIEGILDLELRPRVRVFARVDRFDRFVSVLTYVPRDRYSSTARERIGAYLESAYDGRITAFYPTFTESSLVRVHFIVARFSGATPSVRERELEQAIAGILQTWQDRLASAIATGVGRGADAASIIDRYREAFSAGYAETFAVARALEDIARIERLSEDRRVSIDFYHDSSTDPGCVRAAIYRLGSAMPLSDRVPLLENLGLRVIDERSFKITPHGAMAQPVTLHDMMLELPAGAQWDGGAGDKRLEDGFLAVVAGVADNDGYNRLLLAAGLDWRRAALLRAYGSYMRQLGLPFGPRYLSDILVAQADLAADLCGLFEAHFLPALSEADRRERAARQIERISGKLGALASADEERVLRQFLNLIQATKRTTFYRPADDGRVSDVIAFKLASQEIDGAPEPRPYREIWVYSPRVEGVHLRFAPIARGGLRWSDRPLDFRTEVLGLCKAQQVKNAVIVPAGAKGGFVPKCLPRGGTRDEIQKEGIAAYQMFVSTLLDLTDNLKDGEIVPPRDVVRRDGDDPYLVVAADKGTATFSDIANAISSERDFWLGDAFASGGSQGYDHKRLAITARGAWESVKRHFREMDWDIQTKPFRCIGVGDMSGDVFGNGMLLSPVTKLIAAFDHRDIFLDPDPDPAVSLVERRRLFELPRSSWQDYDKARISQGGGVFARSMRSIPLSPQMRAALGVTAEALAPNDLIRAILQAEVDLLYFGGIGTYIRASTESDDQVGDRANDAVRITGAQLKVKVIGEGANLGMTQRGRIEFAAAGGRLNTDFIDNSAGVNTSDQEVNIKIALRPAVKSGRLSMSERKSLLASLAGDVATAVLRNNYLQSLTISLAERRGIADLGFQQRLIRHLEQVGQLDRRLEGLPSDAEIAERRRVGAALTRPELTVLLSYSKISLQKELLASDMPDDPALEGRMLAYMPSALRAQFRDDVLAHALRREIIATGLTNQVINRGSATFVVRIGEETGRSAADIVRAFVMVERVFGLSEIWTSLDGLDNHLPGSVQNDLYARVQQLIVDRTVWFLRHDGGGKTQSELVYKSAEVVLAMRQGGSDGLPRARQLAVEATRRSLMESGVPAEIANLVAMLEPLAEATDIANLAAKTGTNATVAAGAWLGIGEVMRFGELKARGDALPASDTYDRLAINSALDGLATVQHILARQAIAASVGGNVDLTVWAAKQGPALARARATLNEIASGGELTISRLSVAASQTRALVEP